MSLEGTRARTLDAIRADLYSNLPRPFWRAHAELGGVFDPIKAHPWALLVGLLAGIYLAGPGQHFVKHRR